MTPLFRHPEPDDRPTFPELAFAVGIVLATIAVLYLSDALKGIVQP